MIVGPAPAMPEAFRSYSTAAAANADASAGVISVELASYVSSAFGGLLKPSKVFVGKELARVAQVIGFTITGGDGDYTITINGTDYTHTAASEADTVTATALAALVDADPNVSATSAGADVIVTADTAGNAFTYSSVEDGDGAITETVLTANVGIAETLAALKDASGDWYGFALTSRTDADNLAGAIWAQSNARIGALQSSTAAIKTSATDDIASQIKDAGYSRAFLMYRSDDDSQAAWKLLCNRLAVDPDRESTIWSFVILVGEVIEALNDTEKGHLQSKNVNYYLTFKGQPCTRQGTMPNGQKIDSITGGDWLLARVGETIASDILGAVNRGSKIEHTNAGFAQLTSSVAAVGLLAERTGFYETGTSIAQFVPFEELTEAQVADRCYVFDLGGREAGAAEVTKGRIFITTDPDVLATIFDDE